MKFSISNIAWDTSLDSSIYPLFKEYGYSGIELAPKKYITDIRNPDISEVENLKNLLHSYSLTIPAFQALLFGESDLHLFVSDESRDKLYVYMKKMIDLAEMLGTKVLVFGSPKNRIIPESMAVDSAWIIARDFFSGLGMYASEKGVIIGLEANPPAYGGNFINNTYEAARLVEDVGNPGFQLHIDAGTLIFEEEDLRDIIEKYHDIICHYHVSQPNLIHFGVSAHERHYEFARILKEKKYDGWVSIEMLVKEEFGQSEIIEKSLKLIEVIYDSYAIS